MRTPLYLDEPWVPVLLEQAPEFAEELRRELGPAHPLFDVHAEAVAVRIDRDDGAHDKLHRR